MPGSRCGWNCGSICRASSATGCNLQQVMLNLTLNAIEAMATVEGRNRDLVIRTQSRDEGKCS